METRARLLRAAEELVQSGGVSALRLDDVAQRCGVHRSTVHRYFASKEALIGAVVGQATRRVGDRVLRQLGREATPRALLGHGMVLAIAELAVDPVLRSLVEPAASGLVARVADDVMREGLRPLAEPMFVAAREAGVLRADISVADALDWLFVVAVGLLRSTELTAAPGRLADLIERMLVPSLLVAPTQSAD